MKLLLRILGTWLIGIMLVCLAIDGTKTLAASRLTITSLSQTWRSLHPDSWRGLQEGLQTYLAPVAADGLFNAVLEWPAWVLTGAMGILLLGLGRKKAAPRFLRL